MRRAFLLGFFLILFGATISSRAQGINISLVGSYKPPQSGFGDVWGDGNIACMGVWLSAGYANGFGVGIFNIANPATPNLVATYNFTSGVQNRFEQGVIRSNILYVGSWGGNANGSGLHILSLTNPASPLLLSRITKLTAGTVTNGFDDVHTLFLERNFLYEAAHNAGIVSVKVFNVSNPSLPIYLRDIVTTNTTKVHQMTVAMKGAQTILYTSGWGGNSDGNPNSFGQTDLWDVSNVGSQPAQWLGRIYSGYSSHSSWPTPDGNTLIVCRETPGGEVSFYDISTPPNPTPNSINNPAPLAVISPARMGIEGDIPHNPVVISNLLFLSWYQNGLQIFDISDRAKPVRIGAYDTYTSAGVTNSYNGNWGIYPKLGLNKILVSDINSGFYVLDASAVLTATNNYPPLLVTQPANLLTNHGANASLTAVATGSAIKYQWRFNGTILPGATNSDLVFNDIRATNSGNYFVIASNALGAVTSAVASVSVTVPAGSLPAITAQPANTSVYADNPVSLSVAVTGAAPLFFQWRFNGADISGATNNALNFPQVAPEQVGNYSVMVSNEFGTATSSNALLALIDSPYLNTVRATTGGRSAIISWKSTIASDSAVQYSVAEQIVARAASEEAQAASFASASYIDRTMTTNHTILLTGLTPATRYSFQVISSTETNVFPSGVYQFVTAGAPIILDDTNSAVTFSGTWISSVSVSGYYGSDYRYANVSGTTLRTATFTPNIPTPGRYEVYEWHTAASDRAVNAPFSISYNGGSNIFLVNEQINGGRWNLLGTNFPFAMGTAGFVRLANNAGNSVVIADAVQLIYADAQDTPTNNSVPAWWETFYFGGTVNPQDDPDSDGYTTTQEYVLGTSPVAADSHLELDLQSAGGAANVTFWPYFADRDYQLLQRSNLVDAAWQALPIGAITPTPYGHGIFSLSTANLPQGFYRLQVALGTNQMSAAKSVLRKGTKAIGFGEAACGVNRIYVK